MVHPLVKTIEVERVRYGVRAISEIRNHLFELLQGEWEEDEFNEEWYPEMDNWEWTVETLRISDIELWKPLMEDPAFIRDLEKRVQEQADRIAQNEAIEPVVVRGRDTVIYDGYARLHALKKLGRRKVLAYVGR